MESYDRHQPDSVRSFWRALEELAKSNGLNRVAWFRRAEKLAGLAGKKKLFPKRATFYHWLNNRERLSDWSWGDGVLFCVQAVVGMDEGEWGPWQVRWERLRGQSGERTDSSNGGRRASWQIKWYKMVASIIGFIAAVVSLIAYFIPKSGQAAESSGSAAPTPPSSSATNSRAAATTLEQWAGDINKICDQEATQAGSSFDKMRGALAEFNELSRRHQITSYEGAMEHLDEIAGPMQHAADAATVVDSSYRTALRKMRNVGLPTVPRDRTTAKAWIDVYEQLGGTSSTLYETLRRYASNENDVWRATRFTKAALADGPAYLEQRTKMLDAGRQLGVESCR